jgi:hypothetical protein
MAKQVTIAVGDISDEASAFLRSHGATINGVLIDLPETAHVERGAYQWLYTIGRRDTDGNDEEQYVEIELDIDVYGTRARLGK